MVTVLHICVMLLVVNQSVGCYAFRNSIVVFVAQIFITELYYVTCTCRILYNSRHYCSLTLVLLASDTHNIVVFLADIFRKLRTECLRFSILCGGANSASRHFFLVVQRQFLLFAQLSFGFPLHLLLLVPFLIGGDIVFSCVTCWTSSSD